MYQASKALEIYTQSKYARENMDILTYSALSCIYNKYIYRYITYLFTIFLYLNIFQ